MIQGRREPVEMHHVRRLKDLKAKSKWEVKMIQGRKKWCCARNVIKIYMQED
ncbi:hypothetical protein [Bacillus paranthracis]|uniref:HNH endonuclease n=1 Tax=Bacillus paranthracis TaxID=2026186 RepID=UPI0034DE12D8